jgi:hypothetical protein
MTQKLLLWVEVTTLDEREALFVNGSALSQKANPPIPVQDQTDKRLSKPEHPAQQQVGGIAIDFNFIFIIRLH